VFKKLTFIGFLMSIFVACQSEKPKQQLKLQEASWEQISKEAEGSTVNFVMWQGSPIINNYINNYVVPRLKEELNIDLRISGGQGTEIVQLIMGEKQAGVEQGQADLVWINGETFFQLNKIEGLWGPFVDQIPNTKYIDFTNEFINQDFQQPVNGMECPWGITQFALVYDSAKVPNPPRNLKQLETFVKENPGTFTISNDFSGMSLLKSFLAELSGSPTGLDGDFDQSKYDRLSDSLWNWINANKKYFWKEGQTFPKEHSKMDQLFASGELYLSFGFNEGGIEDKVRQGLFPNTTRSYAWDNGTVKNTNYLGIPYNAKNKAGAMAVINFLISPEAQLKRLTPDEMNTSTILEVNKLPEAWKKKFKEMPGRKYGADLNDLEGHAIKEPKPEYMIKVYEDFRTEVIEK
tara:strand:- start:688 stop:1905 length:1218 start_codon:yes stop_codon:yes gene_type:complete